MQTTSLVSGSAQRSHSPDGLAVEISTLGGFLCQLTVGHKAAVADVKAGVAKATDVPSGEQRLFVDGGARETADTEMIVALGASGDLRVSLLMLRVDVERNNWLKMVAREPWGLYQVPERIRSDPEIVLAAVLSDPIHLQCLLAVPGELLNDRDFAFLALEMSGGRAFRFLSSELRMDREVAGQANLAWASGAMRKHPHILRYLSAKPQASRELIVKARQKDPRLWEYASHDKYVHIHRRNYRLHDDLAVQEVGALRALLCTELGEDREFILEAMRVDPHGMRLALESMSDELRSDRELADLAVDAIGGNAVGFLSTELRGDRDFVLKVVRQKPCSMRCALEHMSDELRNDRELADLAVDALGGFALEFLSEEFRANNDVVLRAMRRQTHHRACEFVSDMLRNDRDFAKLAMDTMGEDAWAFPSTELKANRDFVFEVLRQNPQYISWAAMEMEFISDEMRTDRDVADVFVDVYGIDALEFFTIGLAAKGEVVLKAMREDPATWEVVVHVIEYGYDERSGDPDWSSIIDELHHDREFVLAAIRQNVYPISSLTSEFCADPEVMLCALGHWVDLDAGSWWVSQNIPQALLQHRDFVLEALRIGRDDLFILALGCCTELQSDHELLTMAAQSMDLSRGLPELQNIPQALLQNRHFVLEAWHFGRDDVFILALGCCTELQSHHELLTIAAQSMDLSRGLPELPDGMNSAQKLFVQAVERLQREPMVCLGPCKEITEQGLVRSRHREQRHRSRCRAKVERQRQCLAKQRLRGGRFKPGEEAARLHRLET